MSEQDKPLTVDLTPTWTAAMEIYLAVLQDGTEDGKQVAREAMRDMAKKLEGQAELEHFAFIRGMLHFGNWGRNWQRVRTGLSECFELEEEEAAAAVERYKEATA